MLACSGYRGPMYVPAETCDRCLAWATHVAELASGALLTFCDHHTREQSPGIKAQGGTVTALESRLTDATALCGL